MSIEELPPHTRIHVELSHYMNGEWDLNNTDSILSYHQSGIFEKNGIRLISYSCNDKDFDSSMSSSSSYSTPMGQYYQTPSMKSYSFTIETTIRSILKGKLTGFLRFSNHDIVLKIGNLQGTIVVNSYNIIHESRE